jgi:hypothetical protein
MSPRRSRQPALVTVLLGAVAVLSGCTSGGDPLPIFNEPQRDGDRPPSDVAAIAAAQVDLATTRLAGSHEGANYYLARPIGGGVERVCIVVSGGPTASVSACGTESARVTVEGVLDARTTNSPDEPGWTPISDYIEVKD